MTTLTLKTKITLKTLTTHLKSGMRDKHLKQIIRDTDTQGLSLAVNQGSTGSWWYQYRPKGKNADGKRWSTRSIRLGDTSTHSPDSARVAVSVLKAHVIAGRDPHAEAVEERRVEEVRQLSLKMLSDAKTDYHNYVDKRLKSGDISDRYCSSEKLYSGKAVDEVIAQNLSDTGMADVVLKDINGLDATQAFKTAECSQHAKKHMEGAFNRVMDFCLSKKWLPTNPMLSVPKSQKVKRGSARKVHLSLDEMASLWLSADNEDSVVRDMVRFMLLIPARSGTVTNLDWSHIDMKEKLWTQPPSMTKNKEGIKLQLSPEAVALLQIRRFPTKGKGLVFPSTSGTAFNAWDKLKRRLSEGAGLQHDEWRFHDFRRAFVSVLAEKDKAELQHDETVLDLILNHSASATRGGVLGVYQISQRMEERKSALLDWSNRLMIAVDKMAQQNKKEIKVK